MLYTFVEPAVSCLVFRWTRSTISGICTNYQIRRYASASSAASTPMLASKYAIFSIFADLTDLLSFAPLRTRNLTKIADFLGNLQKMPNYQRNIGSLSFNYYRFSLRTYLKNNLYMCVSAASRGYLACIQGALPAAFDPRNFLGRRPQARASRARDRGAS